MIRYVSKTSYMDIFMCKKYGFIEILYLNKSFHSHVVFEFLFGFCIFVQFIFFVKSLDFRNI